MKRPVSLTDNPVLREIWKIRDQMWEEAGGTFEGLADLVSRREKQASAPAAGRKHKKKVRKPAPRRKDSARLLAKAKSPAKRRKPAGRNRSQTA